MRIILADHHVLPLRPLKARLDEEPDFELIGEAVDAESLLKLANAQTADLILMDYGLPGIPMEVLIASLHAIKPSPIVVVMSSKSEHSRMLLKAGADSFVSKVDHPDWLIQCLRKYMKPAVKEDPNCNRESQTDPIEQGAASG